MKHSWGSFSPIPNNSLSFLGFTEELWVSVCLDSSSHYATLHYYQILYPAVQNQLSHILEERVFIAYFGSYIPTFHKKRYKSYMHYRCIPNFHFIYKTFKKKKGLSWQNHQCFKFSLYLFKEKRKTNHSWIS